MVGCVPESIQSSFQVTLWLRLLVRRILVTAYPPGPILSSIPILTNQYTVIKVYAHTPALIVIHHPMIPHKHLGYSSMQGFSCYYFFIFLKPRYLDADKIEPFISYMENIIQLRIQNTINKCHFAAIAWLF